MIDHQFALLLTVARILRARIDAEHSGGSVPVWRTREDDLAALNEALAPFDPLPGPPTNETEDR